MSPSFRPTLSLGLSLLIFITETPFFSEEDFTSTPKYGLLTVFFSKYYYKIPFKYEDGVTITF